MVKMTATGLFRLSVIGGITSTLTKVKFGACTVLTICIQQAGKCRKMHDCMFQFLFPFLDD